MMAAARAAERGRHVLLLEKNPNLGKKLLITGGGRCNVTNNKPEVRTMLSKYKEAGKFLFSTFMQHGVKESIGWFKRRGVPFKEENEGRLFPATEQAQTIRDALALELKKQGVAVQERSEVTGIVRERNGGFAVQCKKSEVVRAHACVVATGGTSRPETGSTGEGFAWLAQLGHTIIPNNFALVPLALAHSWLPTVAGITLPDVKLTVLADGKKQSSHRGKLLFTHVGVTGPMVLNVSGAAGELLGHSTVVLAIDLFPEQDAGALKAFLQELFVRESNKKLRNALATALPTAIVTALLETAGIDAETPVHSVVRADRTKLLGLFKAWPLTVKGLLGADKAVVSAGGVDLREVDFRTMESRLVPGLYLVGDVLNINRPSGGYSLQLCWSTGFVAGEHA